MSFPSPLRIRPDFTALALAELRIARRFNCLGVELYRRWRMESILAPGFLYPFFGIVFLGVLPKIITFRQMANKTV